MQLFLSGTGRADLSRNHELLEMTAGAARASRVCFCIGFAGAEKE
jgi:hypothetical protein